MGVFFGGYSITPQELTDAGIERDENGNISDPKALLKLGLIDEFNVTKDKYNSMSPDQKARFTGLTGIDDLDFEDDNTEAARTCVDSLQTGEAAAELLENLKRLHAELE